MGLIVLGAACLLIRVGLTLYATGLVRAKNAAGLPLRFLADWCLVSLAFWLIGSAIFAQHHNPYFAISSHDVAFRQADAADPFFLLCVMLIGSGGAIGPLAERSRFFPLWSVSILLGAIIFPLGAMWSWHGWLRRLGLIDVGGCAWLHVPAAIFAAVGALAVGARHGKYHRDGSTSMIPGHNVPLAGIGALLVFIGWAPYLAGCLLLQDEGGAVGPAAAEMFVSASAAGTAAMLLGQFRYGKPDIILTLMGFLGGLVAISAGAGHIAAPSAVLMGAVAGIIVPLCAIWIDLVLKIDDPMGAIAVHGVGGAWGVLASGFLASGSPAHRLHQTGVQALALAVLAAMAAVASAGLFVLLRLTVALRAREAGEYDGLDLAEHDISAYPDFQQTMIKSYDLREA